MRQQETQHPIVINNISKKYSISHKDQSDHHTIKDAIVDAAKKPLQLVDSHYGKSKEEIWALRDVSFVVKQGQVMAVMGRNGSGKSTLFKILAKVTSPTSGEAIINGRVGSLLEVGAGFHPELTGRENVHFNGSILGMKKAEIYKKFNSILEFAEMDKFIDTPVKFYSSGMKVRLAFSIAIHLDTDILLMDEVLAVGDYTFKMKCFETMEKIAQQGKTILFVSHIPGQVRRICTHGVLLKEGQLIFQGEVEDVIQQYLGSIEDEMDEDGDEQPLKFYKSDVKLDKIASILNIKTTLSNPRSETFKDLRLLVNIKKPGGNIVFSISNTYFSKALQIKDGEKLSINFSISNISLPAGEYIIAFRVSQDEKTERILALDKKAASLTITPSEAKQLQNGVKQDASFSFDCTSMD